MHVIALADALADVAHELHVEKQAAIVVAIEQTDDEKAPNVVFRSVGIKANAKDVADALRECASQIEERGDV